MSPAKGGNLAPIIRPMQIPHESKENLPKISLNEQAGARRSLSPVSESRKKQKTLT